MILLILLWSCGVITNLRQLYSLITTGGYWRVHHELRTFREPQILLSLPKHSAFSRKNGVQWLFDVVHHGLFLGRMFVDFLCVPKHCSSLAVIMGEQLWGLSSCVVCGQSSIYRTNRSNIIGGPTSTVPCSLCALPISLRLRRHLVWNASSYSTSGSWSVCLGFPVLQCLFFFVQPNICPLPFRFIVRPSLTTVIHFALWHTPPPFDWWCLLDNSFPYLCYARYFVFWLDHFWLYNFSAFWSLMQLASKLLNRSPLQLFLR